MPENKTADSYKLGMFGGVFTPSILTILGIILFLRMGYTVGNAGFGKVILLITIANLVSVITTASLSAIATNIQVKGGGAYYLISRTLGVQFGGAIGLVLFLAQSVSIAFYCIGFGEAVSGLVLNSPWAAYLTARNIAMIAVILLFSLAWMGADWATRFQYIVMVLLVVALASFFIGGISRWSPPVFMDNFAAPSTGLPFWVLFALFFPAVTGFTQGLNMSGDLKDPGRAIPFGTFLAVGLSIVIYYLSAVVFAGSMPNELLMADYNAMKKVSFLPVLIDAGVIAATLSSAMASFLGSPRILQSISRDKIFKVLHPFSKGVGVTDNPRRGVWLSFAIAMATICLGQLNLIAQVVSMFFLISYGLINYATFYEARTQNPSFRPRFRWFNPWMSLAGFIICTGAMLAIDIKAGIMAVSVLAAIHQYLKHRAGPARWADSRRSHYLQRAKENLMAASGEPAHDRDWRPVILAFTNDSKRMGYLLEFAGWLEGRAGMTAAVRMIEGRGLKAKPRKKEVLEALTIHVNELNTRANPLVLSVPKIPTALPVVIQSFGLGPFKANTALVNWMDELGKGVSGIGPYQYAKNLRIAYREGLNLVVLNTDEHKKERIEIREPQQEIIDIWWRDDATSRLMLLFAHLMTRRDIWSKALIRVLTIKKIESAENLGTSPKEDETDTRNELQKFLEEIRIDAEPVVVPDNSVNTILETSSPSSFVFLPFRIRDHQVLDADGGSLQKLLPYLPMTALVMAAQDIDLEAEPDTGLQGELARAEDDLDASVEKYETAGKEAKRAKQKAEALTLRLTNLSRDSDDFKQVLKESDQALEEEEDAFRRAAKAKAKADETAKNFEQILQPGKSGGTPSG